MLPPAHWAGPKRRQRGTRLHPARLKGAECQPLQGWSQRGTADRQGVCPGVFCRGKGSSAQPAPWDSTAEGSSRTGEDRASPEPEPWAEITGRRLQVQTTASFLSRAAACPGAQAVAWSTPGTHGVHSRPTPGTHGVHSRPTPGSGSYLTHTPHTEPRVRSATEGF